MEDIQKDEPNKPEEKQEEANKNEEEVKKEELDENKKDNEKQGEDKNEKENNDDKKEEKEEKQEEKIEEKKEENNKKIEENKEGENDKKENAEEKQEEQVEKKKNEENKEEEKIKEEKEHKEEKENKEENKEEKVEEKKEEKKEKEEKEQKEEKNEEIKKEEKEENKENENKNEETNKEEKEEKENKNEETKKEDNEENEINEEEEDRKELYEAIEDLKPDEASDNIKSKLIIISEIHLEQKRVENDQYLKEYDALEDKYEKKYAEIYEKINSVVKSKEKIELTPEEMKQYDIKDEAEVETKPIDDYWEKVVINSRYFTITEKDKKILKYLTNVKYIKYPESLNDFRVDFYFDKNEFFENEILSKKYIFGKDSSVKKAEGSSIDWKSPDKNTTIEKIKKKVKKGKKYITETKEQKVDSFFSFFSQVDNMTFISDEVTFFREDLFGNQLEYYLDIVSKTKNGGLDDDDAEVKEIEDYWEKVIINSRYFTITDKDKIILKYLHKVKMVKFPGNNNHNINDFRIDFYFKENEFFSNEILSKTYIYQKDATLKKAEGTKIEWKSPDKNTTIEKVRKKVKKGKRYFNEEKEKKVDSFFSFFEMVDDMQFLTDEVTFFRDDLFVNQLEYYLDIVSKTKNGGFDDAEDYDDNYDDYDNDNNYYDKYDKGRKDDRHGGNDGKKEECKQQ